ncbi:Holliday junction resolvase RuvX [bacterium]|nr:Holliday junction resolvase RuvX [bacterium]
MAGRILGIDYGTKRIGVAVSDPLRIIAQGLRTLEHKSTAQVIVRIKEIIAKYGVTTAVVGLPLTLGGGQSSTTQKVKTFVKILQAECQLPVALMDERFTSKLAEGAMREMGKSASRNKGMVDEIAAAIMLQTYLDRFTSREN